jgi:hypothetical protein
VTHDICLLDLGGVDQAGDFGGFAPRRNWDRNSSEKT